MIAARASHPPATGDTALWLCAVLALALHGALLFAWKIAPEESAAASIEGDSVEVALIASAPAAEAAAEPQPQPPTAVPPEPATVPPPEPEKKSEMVLPEPPKPTPTPRPASTAVSPSRTTPAPARRNPSSRNSTSAGTPGSVSTGASSGTSNGRIAKASYVTRPVAAYPPESRTAGEQGVVILRLVVDGNGRPTAVSVAKSSGHPRLDRAAVEAGWRCRVRDAAPGTKLDAPVRFNLHD